MHVHVYSHTSNDNLESKPGRLRTPETVLGSARTHPDSLQEGVVLHGHRFVLRADLDGILQGTGIWCGIKLRHHQETSTTVRSAPVLATTDSMVVILFECGCWFDASSRAHPSRDRTAWVSRERRSTSHPTHRLMLRSVYGYKRCSKAQATLSVNQAGSLS